MNIWLHDYHKTAGTKRMCGERRRGSWHIRPALLADSKRRRSTAAASPPRLSFLTTEQEPLATSRTYWRLWRSAKEQPRGVRSILLALRHLRWAASRQLKHLVRLRLHVTGSSTMKLKREYLVKSRRLLRHEMGMSLPPRLSNPHQTETRGGEKTLTRTGLW